MGREIEKAHFHKKDYTLFRKELEKETDEVIKWCQHQHESTNHSSLSMTSSSSSEISTIGYELEINLVNANTMHPSCDHTSHIINSLNTSDNHDNNTGFTVTHELAKWQIEYNSPIFILQKNVFTRMQYDMEQFIYNTTHAMQREFNDCSNHQEDDDNCNDVIVPVMIGAVPTFSIDDFQLHNITDLNRYHALNEQVNHFRHGKQIHLKIDYSKQEEENKRYKDKQQQQQKHQQQEENFFELDHDNIMLEAVCSALQLHWQIPKSNNDACINARYYNASLIVTPFIVAIAANSPTMFQHCLWNESRIPILEQAANFDHVRVWFATKFCQNSIVECFQENLNFPIILPDNNDTMSDDDSGDDSNKDDNDKEQSCNTKSILENENGIKHCNDNSSRHFSHLSLHNGTLWRWHRPLIGFTNGNPHIRMEQRSLPSGPTVIDSVANAAFFYGLVHALVMTEEQCKDINDTENNNDAMIRSITDSFETVNKNFYDAAKLGLDAELVFNGKTYNAANLITDKLVSMADKGLESLGIDRCDIVKYTSIIRHRAETKQNGATWQLSWLKQHNYNFDGLLRAYIRNQQSGKPVAQWSYMDPEEENDHNKPQYTFMKNIDKNNNDIFVQNITIESVDDNVHDEKKLDNDNLL